MKTVRVSRGIMNSLYDIRYAYGKKYAYSRYTFIHEHWDKIGRYILATRKVFGMNEEIVRVVIRYD